MAQGGLSRPQIGYPTTKTGPTRPKNVKNSPKNSLSIFIQIHLFCPEDQPPPKPATTLAILPDYDQLAPPPVFVCTASSHSYFPRSLCIYLFNFFLSREREEERKRARDPAQQPITKESKKISWAGPTFWMSCCWHSLVCSRSSHVSFSVFVYVNISSLETGNSYGVNDNAWVGRALRSQRKVSGDALASEMGSTPCSFAPSPTRHVSLVAKTTGLSGGEVGSKRGPQKTKKKLTPCCRHRRHFLFLFCLLVCFFSVLPLRLFLAK